MTPLTRLPWLALSTERTIRRAREQAMRWRTPCRMEPLALVSREGHALPCRLHLPPGEGPFPAVFLCPGGLDGARGVEGLSPVLTAQRLAREGFAALAWTPSGREGAPGPEDRNGPIHQEEAARALRRLVDSPRVDPRRVGVVSISFGLVLALGALTHPQAPAVRGLIDWEGPPSRSWFVASRLRYRTTDEAWWEAREAVGAIRRLQVPYWRFQSRWDHVHGPDNALGGEMVDAARAARVPDVRYNGRPADEPRREGPFWVAEQADELLTWVRELLLG